MHKYIKIVAIATLAFITLCGCSSNETESPKMDDATYELEEPNEVLEEAHTLIFDSTFIGDIGKTENEWTDDSDWYELDGLDSFTVKTQDNQIIGIITYNKSGDTIMDYYTEEGIVKMDLTSEDAHYIEFL